MRNGMACVGCAPMRGTNLRGFGESTAGTFFVGFLLFATAASIGYAVGFERGHKR